MTEQANTPRIKCEDKTVMQSGDACLVSRLSRDMVFHVSVLAQSRHLYVSSFREWSCLMCHDCVLTVFLSGISKCLFFVETLAFLAESRPLYVHLLLFTYLP